MGTVPPEQRVSPPAHATGAVEFVDLADVAGDETFRLRLDGDVTQLATSLGRLGQLAPIELRAWSVGTGDGPRWQVVAGFRRLAAVRLLARDRVLARLHAELSDDDAWGLALSEALLREPLSGEELGALRERLRVAGVAPWAEELIDEALVRAPVPAELRERFYDFLTGATAAEPVPATGDTAPAAPAPPAPAEAAPPPVEAEPALASEPPLAAEPAPGHLEGDAAAPTRERVPVPAVLVVPYEPAPGDGAGEVPAPEGAPASEPPAARPDEIVEVTPEELAQDVAARLWALNQDLATAFEAWEDLPVAGRRAIVDQARYVADLFPLLEAKG